MSGQNTSHKQCGYQPKITSLINRIRNKVTTTIDHEIYFSDSILQCTFFFSIAVSEKAQGIT
jgi:hypothetical protein